MYKIVALTRRKPGLTKDEYRDYYETHHVQFGDKHLKPYCTRYLRRYLTPIDAPMNPTAVAAPDYDAIVEIWFESEERYRAFEASVTSPEDIKLIVEDEERYLDRANTHRYLVDEVEHWKET